jgi:excisionase family DNA binding protein
MKQSYPFNLSVAEVAEHFGLTPRTIRERIKQGDLRAVRVGGEWRLCWPDVWAVEKGPMPKASRAVDFMVTLLTKREYGALWGKSERTVERWIAAGLPTRNVFGHAGIAPTDAAIWVKQTFGLFAETQPKDPAERSHTAAYANPRQFRKGTDSRTLVRKHLLGLCLGTGL